MDRALPFSATFSIFSSLYVSLFTHCSALWGAHTICAELALAFGANDGRGLDVIYSHPLF